MNLTSKVPGKINNPKSKKPKGKNPWSPNQPMAVGISPVPKTVARGMIKEIATFLIRLRKTDEIAVKQAGKRQTANMGWMSTAAWSGFPESRPRRSVANPVQISAQSMVLAVPRRSMMNPAPRAMPRQGTLERDKS